MVEYTGNLIFYMAPKNSPSESHMLTEAEARKVSEVHPIVSKNIDKLKSIDSDKKTELITLLSKFVVRGATVAKMQKLNAEINPDKANLFYVPWYNMAMDSGINIKDWTISNTTIISPQLLFKFFKFNGEQGAQAVDAQEDKIQEQVAKFLNSNLKEYLRNYPQK